MTWIKICGTTNLEDALLAADAGADAVGFVFYGKSPRNITVDAAREIIEKLPKGVEAVGVFVDLDSEGIREVVLQAGLTAVQLHGQRSIESVWTDERPALESVGTAKVIPMMHGDALADGGSFVGKEAREKIFALLLDSRSDGTEGGTGTSFDWEATRGMVQALSLTVPVIVAGGLTPSNVSRALALFQPFGVDVVSGVEASPGKKSPDKVRQFVKMVRDLDRKTS